MEILGWALLGMLVVVGSLVALRVVLAAMLKRAAGKLRGVALDEIDAPATRALEGRSTGLLYFFSPRCGACRAMTPVVRELSRKNPSVRLVDISQDMASARAFGIMGTPSLVAIRDGRVAEVRVGPVGRAEIEQLAAG